MEVVAIGGETFAGSSPPSHWPNIHQQILTMKNSSKFDKDPEVELDRLRAETQPALGRRPVADKRMMIRIFPQQSRIAAMGGEAAMKLKLMAYIEKAFAATGKKKRKK